MNAIDTMFADCRRNGRKAFIPFLTAGDPDISATPEVIRAAAQAGADLIEIGFPFSDPIADGPVIQAAYTRALNRGLKVQEVFDAIRSVTADPAFRTPLVGMVSFSLIFRRGPERFLEDCRSAGLSGLVVPDLPGEEAEAFSQLCRNRDVKLILLITPTTTPDRAAKITAQCSGFVYCVSIVGITGERSALPGDLTRQLAHLRTVTDLPLCVGFGVSKPEHVRNIKAIADGVIVGSALVRRMESGGAKAVADAIRELNG